MLNRRSVVCCLAAALILCGLASAGEKGVGTGRYKEAPMLNKLVQAGKLPPIEQRLPKEPAVVRAPTVGTYGGQYRGGAFGPTHGNLDTEALRYGSLLTIEKDFKTFKPNIIRDFKVNENFTEFTLYLREGMKWSNGDPLTSADFLFWYEDVLSNPDVTPGVSERWKSQGNLVKFVAVNDYEVKLIFTDPYPSFEIVMARVNQDDNRRNFLAPKEFLKKFHIRYNPDADKLAKELGFNTWVLCLQEHLNNSQSQSIPNVPDFWAWTFTAVTPEGNKIYSRNPFYHVVDQEGNQLPYMDEQVAVLVQDAQVRTMKLISGELDGAAENPLPVRDYTLYKENEAKGNYTVHLFDNTRGSDAAVMFNITHKDPVMRDVFSNVKFREAMSLAIDRDEINSTLFYGRANVRMATATGNVSFLDPKWEDYMTEFDPDRANAVLDELGYKWNGDGTARLMPDGREFNLVLEAIEEFVPQSEMVAEYFTAVGVRTQLRQQERNYYRERVASNDVDLLVFTLGGVSEYSLRSDAFNNLRPGGQLEDLSFMQAYRLWFITDGEQGEEPPEFIKTLYAKCREFGTLPPDHPNYQALGKETLDEINSNLWFLGTSVAPRVVILSNRLGNTPTEGIFAEDYNFWKPFRGDTWYVK